MGRPRKIDKAEMPPTERVIAPETVMQQPVQPVQPVQLVQAVQPRYTPPAPRQMRIERGGDKSEAYVRHFPQVRGGICEFCGVLDPNVPSQYQYKLCPHYRGQQLRCSYCPEGKDPDDVIYHSKLEIVEHPDKPGVMIVICSSTECEKKHQERFKVSV